MKGNIAERKDIVIILEKMSRNILLDVETYTLCILVLVFRGMGEEGYL